MANTFYCGGMMPQPATQVGLLGQQPSAAANILGVIGSQPSSGAVDPASNNQPLQFNSRQKRHSSADKDEKKESPSNTSSTVSSTTQASMVAPCSVMPPGGPAAAMMMNPAQAGMMMPWAAMMGPMMDPSMMMWGGWGGMGMMGAMNEADALPQAQREIIKLKNAVLHPPPANSLPASTRERPPGCKTVFIGGLPENVTEEILQEMFSNCGTICSLRLSKKNFAHIRFSSMDSVDKALYFSGYRMKIDDKEDKANTGRLHVDFAQARDDLHDWECIQRQLLRESRHRERLEEALLRPPSPPTVVHYSDHEAMMLIDAVKDNSSFQQAAQTLITWFDRGDCNRRTSSTFYTLIQSANGHVRRLLAEKKDCAEELEQMKIKFRLQLESIVNQYDLIDRVFAAAGKQKSWDHFTKAQRKNLETWRKQLQTVKAKQEAELIQNRGGEAEMELSDTEDTTESITMETSSCSAVKRRKLKVDSNPSTTQTAEEMLSMAAEWIGKSQQRDENDTLKCQLEAVKNEMELVKVEAQNNVEMKDKQIKYMQMALQGMQQQLIKVTQEAKRDREVATKTRQETKSDRDEQTKKKAKIAETEEHDYVAVQESDDDDDDDGHPSTPGDEKEQEQPEDVNGESVKDDSPMCATSTSQQLPATSSTQLLAKEARIIALITSFLLSHPFGTSIDHIWSYLSRLNVKIRSSELDELLEKYPSVFGSPSDVFIGGIEKRWKFVGFESNSSA